MKISIHALAIVLIGCLFVQSQDTYAQEDPYQMPPMQVTGTTFTSFQDSMTIGCITRILTTCLTEI